MKQDLQKQLQQYTKMAGAALAAAPLAMQAQAVYEDVDPDLTLMLGDGVALDMNGDGTDDFLMSVFSTVATSGSASLVQNLAVVSGGGVGAFAGSTAVFGTNTFYFPGAYNAGDAINSTLDWAGNTALGSLNYYTFYTSGGGTPSSFYGGNWVNQSDKYLAVRFTAGSDLHYGWIRMDVGAPDATNFITIKDFAFESQPDVAIDAGDTVGAMPSVIPTTEAPELDCYAYGNKLIVRSQDAAWAEGRVDVMDLSGRTIASREWTGGEAHLQLKAADGIYSAVLHSSTGAVTTRKFFVGRMR